MQFSATVLPLLALALPARAIITGVVAPSSVSTGTPFTLTLDTADFIQSVYDVSVAFGVAPGAGNAGALGDVFYSAYLGPQLSNVLTPIHFTVLLDDGVAKGDATIVAAVTSLFGVGATPDISFFNTTVTVA
jgi:hypothetical protein